MNGVAVDMGVVGPFLAAVILIELTPGPNMGYLAALSASEGRGAGFRAVLGVTAGLAFYMLLAVAGVAELIAAAPLVYGALRWAGVTYLLFLSWQSWRGAGETSPGRTRGVDHEPFLRGLLANLLNPKAVVFYVTLLPGFIAPERLFWPQALLLGTLHLLVSFGVHLSIVVGAARAGTLLARAGYAERVRRLLALGTAAIAVWLAWETR